MLLLTLFDRTLRTFYVHPFCPLTLSGRLSRTGFHSVRRPAGRLANHLCTAIIGRQNKKLPSISRVCILVIQAQNWVICAKRQEFVSRCRSFWKNIKAMLAHLFREGVQNFFLKNAADCHGQSQNTPVFFSAKFTRFIRREIMPPTQLPWYIVLLLSIPQTFLIVKIGFQLFNLHVSYLKALFLSLIISIVAIFARELPLLFGVHTQ